MQCIVEKVNDVAVLPQVVFKIVESTANLDTTGDELERTIRVDPGFSAKVLTLANSALFALPRKITSIKDAVLMLGFKQVRQLAMQAGLFDLFAGKTDKESLRRRTWWRHSLDTALCAKWLAERYREVNPDEAYTCGLIHYLGKTIMDRFDSAQYDKVMAFVEQGGDDFEAECAVFGCDHVDVLLAVAGRWGFPPVIIRGLDYMAPSKPDATEEHLRAVVSVSDHIAHLAVSGASQLASSRLLLPMWALDVLAISPFEQQEIIDGGIAAIADSRQSQ